MRLWGLILGLVIGCKDKGGADSASGTDEDGDGYTVADGDCDDANAAINPAATEIEDELDNDCDGVADEYLSLNDDDADGWAEGAGDCDDDDAAVNPDAAEVAGDGVDNNCDGETDESQPDADGDGITTEDGDCDDADATVYPGATDTPYDGVDSDCDEGSDYDADGDGHDSDAYAGDDCDDTDPSTYPEADEICDGQDQDCDDLLDNGAVDAVTGYPDDDGDGYGNPSISQPFCVVPETFSTLNTDCDDADASINPGASEICGDAVDSDCDGSTDDGVGTSEDCTATSCLGIYSADPSSPDGLYWIDPVGEGATEVTCDMTGGGWTLVYRGTNAGAVAENGTVEDPGQLGTLPITSASEGSNKLSDEAINGLRSGDVVNDLKVMVYVDGALLGTAWHLSFCELQTGVSLPADDFCNASTTAGADSTDWEESTAEGTLTRWGVDGDLGYVWGLPGISLGPVTGGTETGELPTPSCSWSDEDALCPVATAVEIWAY